MNGPIPLIKDFPGFLYTDVPPLAWALAIPFMVLWVLWVMLTTPLAKWNERD